VHLPSTHPLLKSESPPIMCLILQT
jgi:hypothetical protein